MDEGARLIYDGEQKDIFRQKKSDLRRSLDNVGGADQTVMMSFSFPWIR